ncbi:VWA domain-containing protein [Streptomyces sp. C10-9-1]|uniref:VWA domain-containing protein n=1 Tax=Streptomyces sp. C10-9-1 TaxID=1859285 RepID=UPI003F49CD9D
MSLFKKKHINATTGFPHALVSLAKTAKVSLEKQGIADLRAAVYLVVDRSLSMSGYYGDGSVQHLADQALGLSVNLDDDGTVPMLFFDDRPYPIVEISLDHYDGVVAQQHKRHGGGSTMGGTRYADAMRAITDHYADCRARGTTDPALVLFQTDGAPQDRAAAQLELARASEHPLFWAFIGFGPTPVPFLQGLDDLPGRAVDNASYFHAGARPTNVPDADLYDGITSEVSPWLAAARANGILR